MMTIVWDIDDVLNDLMREWHRRWLKSRGAQSIRYEDLTENPPDRMLGISREAYLKSLDDFRLSSQYQELTPQPEVLTWFEGKGARYHHIALTAVPFRAAPASAQWVIRNFGKWIRTFHFVPSKRTGEEVPEYDANKAEVLKRIANVHCFVDDNPEQVAAAGKAGIRALLYPRPWNRSMLPVAKFLEQIDPL